MYISQRLAKVGLRDAAYMTTDVASDPTLVRLRNVRPDYLLVLLVRARFGRVLIVAACE